MQYSVGYKTTYNLLPLQEIKSQQTTNQRNKGNQVTWEILESRRSNPLWQPYRLPALSKEISELQP